MKYLIIVFFVLYNYSLYSQECLPGGITLDTQQEVDDFATNYPDCKTILGYLSIGNDPYIQFNISSLSGLSQIEKINGNLTINYNYNLHDLEGLQNLAHIGGTVSLWNNSVDSLTPWFAPDTILGDLSIFNTELRHLKGLENLSEIGGSLNITDHVLMTSTQGVENLKKINGDLIIRKNDYIENLSGFSNLDSLDGRIDLFQNIRLKNIQGLSNIDPTTICSGNSEPDLNISSNFQLSACSIESVCGVVINSNKNTTITNNAIGCESKPVVEQTCITGCPTSITISTQSDIDNFATNYPGCDHISGILSISGSDISDLSGLSQLDTINDLQITSNTILTTLDGLNASVINDIFIGSNPVLIDIDGINISNVDKLNIINNNTLIDLSDLSNLIEINEVFNVTDNSNISSLSLPNINAIKGAGINISRNPSLTSIQSLSNSIDSVNSVSIIANDLLTSLNGLSGLRKAHLDIWLNPKITDLTGLENLQASYEVVIRDNILLNSISQLSNLTESGIVQISGNNSLTSLTGLEGINRLESISIFNNNNLNTLSGLDNLQSLRTTLNIAVNPALVNLNALSNLTIIRRAIYVNSNTSLTDITGLSNVNPDTLGVTNPFLDDIVTITGNTSLSSCSIETFCNYFKRLRIRYDVQNNGPGCNTKGQIVQGCNPNYCVADITFTNQIEINNFLINYPSCDTIAGNVLIEEASNEAITNLDGLQNIKAIWGSLVIKGNDQLANLTGLDELQFIGEFLTIDNNSGLTSLSGLESLESIREYFRLQNNQSLQSVLGLSSFKMIETGPLFITNNDALLTLDGLDSLVIVRRTLSIEDNLILNDISGLSNIDPRNLNDVGLPGDNLIINDNPALSICNIENICDWSLLQEGNPFIYRSDISNNALGCDDLGEIKEACFGAGDIPFITTWKTDNAGTSNSTSITIPTVGTGYNYAVDWNNDGIYDESNLTSSVTHDFGSPGTYTIAIRGRFPRFRFNLGGDKLKLIDINQWGNISWLDMLNSFTQCSNLNISATDSPNFLRATNLSSMFGQCTSLDANLNHWDVSTITNMDGMFFNATSFNSNLDQWEISNVETMFGMLNNTNLSIENYDSILIGWSRQSVQDSVNLGAANLSFCNSEVQRDSLINEYDWDIQGDARSCGIPFITTWKTDNPGSSNNSSITFYTQASFNPNYNVDWDNDGIFDEFNLTGPVTHDFGTPGTYTIRIEGFIPDLYNIASGDQSKLIDIVQWGDNAWLSLWRAFQYCNNLEISATDAPNLSNGPNMQEMFSFAAKVNADFNNWDVSQVTIMNKMFNEAYLFNGNISDWDVSNVTNMREMFQSAQKFNQDISDWNISSTTNLTNWLRGAIEFDQDLGDLNIAHVTDMTDMIAFTGMSVANYDTTLIKWSNQNVQSNVPLGASNLKYCNGENERNDLINNKNWIISGDSKECPIIFDPFITTWKTDNNGTSNNSSITIPTTGSGYNYDVDWDNDGIYDQLGITGSVTHNFGSAGTYTIAIRGDFPRIYFNNQGDQDKLIEIKQWGEIAWTSMNNAFAGANRIYISATDSPDLSNVTDLSRMFFLARTLFGNLNSWDVSNVTNMKEMFSNATGFNSDISSWNVANVTDMEKMFSGGGISSMHNFNQDISGWNVSSVVNMSNMFAACRFNQNISSWNVQSVMDMSGMFAEAQNFNQNISSWNVSNVTKMRSMFSSATNFNQPLDNWNVSNVTDMSLMFASSGMNQDLNSWNTANVTTMAQMFSGASSFNGNITSWSTGNVTDMLGLFTNASNFNQNIGAWNVSSVTNFGSTFTNATSFNQDISTWNTSSATNMWGMFQNATNFDHSLGAWNMENVTLTNNMLNNSGISIANYDNTLIGWSSQNLKSFNNLGAVGLFYCQSENQRQSMIDNFSWTFTGDAEDCPVFPFITTWKTNNPGTSNNQSITIPTYPGLTYNYDVDWNNDGVFDQTGITGPITHDFGSPGTYTIGIRGDFPAIYFNNSGDKSKIIDIDQWGNTEWDRFNFSFFGCNNLNISASDAPDLRTVTSLVSMFENATTLNVSLNHWDVSQVELMFRMFKGATSFNSNINDWNTSQVRDMSNMFEGATAFNQNIGSWDMSNVSNLTGMFKSAPAFNQDIGGWNFTEATIFTEMFYFATQFNQDLNNWDMSNASLMVSMFEGANSFNGNIANWNVGNVTNMWKMFRNASSFNQNISNWNTSKVISMSNMFRSASSFNQNLGNWNITSCTNMVQMLSSTALSISNYDNTLIGWESQAVNSNISFAAFDLQYCNGEDARNALINNHNWSIADDGKFCGTINSFITTWKTDNPGTSNNQSITIPTQAGFTYNYDVDWNNDGVFDQLGLTGSVTHDFGSPGEYSVGIRGTFPSIYFANTGDKDKIIRIDQWGNIQWETFNEAFWGASNLTYNATDTPNLSQCTLFRNIFRGATIFNGDINSWDVSTITNMQSAFQTASAFNQDLHNWDVSNVRIMRFMFSGALMFNGNVSSWNVQNVTDMRYMFSNANKFNQNINQWNIESITSLRDFLANTHDYNQPLDNWDLSNVTELWGMFYNASSFNQNISNWDVSNVDDMNYLFQYASSFNQDLSRWNVTNLNTGIKMLAYSGLSLHQYNKVLLQWSNLPLQQNVTFGVDNLEYCSGESGRNMLINNFNWDVQGDINVCCPVLFDNEWIGPSNGNWDGNINNWSQLRLPGECDRVIIPSGITIDIEIGVDAICHSLEVANGSTLVGRGTLNAIRK